MDTFIYIVKAILGIIILGAWFKGMLCMWQTNRGLKEEAKGLFVSPAVYFSNENFTTEGNEARKNMFIAFFVMVIFGLIGMGVSQLFPFE